MPFGCVAYEALKGLYQAGVNQAPMSPMPFGCVAYEAWTGQGMTGTVP